MERTIRHIVGGYPDCIRGADIPPPFVGGAVHDAKLTALISRPRHKRLTAAVRQSRKRRDRGSGFLAVRVVADSCNSNCPVCGNGHLVGVLRMDFDLYLIL